MKYPVGTRVTIWSHRDMAELRDLGVPFKHWHPIDGAGVVVERILGDYPYLVAVDRRPWANETGGPACGGEFIYREEELRAEQEGLHEGATPRTAG